MGWASLRYTGHWDDSSVGLIYFGARYYSAQLNRFITPDPLTVHGFAGDPNPYAFVGGSPMGNVDPMGLDTNVTIDLTTPPQQTSGGGDVPAPTPNSAANPNLPGYDAAQAAANANYASAAAQAAAQGSTLSQAAALAQAAAQAASQAAATASPGASSVDNFNINAPPPPGGGSGSPPPLLRTGAPPTGGPGGIAGPTSVPVGQQPCLNEGGCSYHLWLWLPSGSEIALAWQSILEAFGFGTAAVPILTRASGGKMLGQAFQYLREATGAQRLSMFRQFAQQITQATAGQWSAAEIAATNGTIFAGEGGEALVFDAAGNMFRGSLADRAAFALGQGGAITVGYELLRQIK